jgi:hypothetical protein
MHRYSNALDLMDNHRNEDAIVLLREILSAYPDFSPAQRNLDKLTARPSP